MSTFAGVNVDEVDAALAAAVAEQEAVTKRLTIDKVTISSTGELEIRFSKKI